MTDEEFAVRVGEFRSGDGERRSEGFQQGLEGRIGLPVVNASLPHPDNPPPDRLGGGLGAITHVELLEDVADVAFHGVLGDA